MKKKSIIKLLVLVSLIASFSLALSPIDIEKPTEDIQIEPISQVTEEVKVDPIQITEKSDEKQQEVINTELLKQQNTNESKDMSLSIYIGAILCLVIFIFFKFKKSTQSPA